MRTFKTLIPAILLTGLSCPSGYGQQHVPATIITIEVETFVEYFNDTFDTTKWATIPTVTSVVFPKNFTIATAVADVVSVNGQPVKGTMLRDQRSVSLNANPTPGQAIGDTGRLAVVTDYFEVQKPDGTPIGTIISTGVGPGTPPPGAPLSAALGNFAIISGTGAFLGVRGQVAQNPFPQTSSLRQASVTEDPANRRLNGGGRTRFLMHVIPLERPDIMRNGNGPSIYHSADALLVSSNKPAAAGETLTLLATGLGPTKPGVDPGSPFAGSPSAAVNSPVAITVNGQSAEVLEAIGYPGTVDAYQVTFRVPTNAAQGIAAIQIFSAWIAGVPAKIAIQ